MVRRIWKNRVVQGVVRLLRLFFRWLLVWLSYFVRQIGHNVRAFGHMVRNVTRPRNPNNLFVAEGDPGHDVDEVHGDTEPAGDEATSRGGLLWASDRKQGAVPEAELATTAISLWRGDRKVAAADAIAGSRAANERYAFLSVLAAQLKRITPDEIDQLDEIVQRLARKWLDIDQSFEWIPRRNRLDIVRTLRHNIPRYAGRILEFRWAVKERPVPKLSKPARILVIGDVSHSMVHYMTVVLYFMHKLNFRFAVDSYVFSQKATHSAPFLNGLGTFEEKVKRLVAGASSWNAGTRFGSALEEVAAEAYVDENTYVIIATDGKVSLQGGEADKIERYMTSLKRKAKSVIFLTPSVEFSEGAVGKGRAARIGSFKSGFEDIPIFEAGPPLWYGVLGKYSDRLYLIRTVQDLIDMTQDLIAASREQ